MILKSPLNYTGSKKKLLDRILPVFPKDIDNFVDLFAGGLNVGINVNANTIYVNDRITYIIELYELFRSTNTDDLLQEIYSFIKEYQLDQNSSEGYYRLRNDFNATKKPILLFILGCYCFSFQIRFNNSMEFNMPYGKEKHKFNASIEKNLLYFVNALQTKNFVFSSLDFREFDYDQLKPGDVVYCDPPYLISTAAYNDGNRGFGDWKQKDDQDLLNTLDMLNDKGIKFVLSNVFIHRDQINYSLIEWSKKYNVIYMDRDYTNAQYNLKNRKAKTVEVLITNY